MLNLNEERMAAVIQEAFDKVAGHRRWETAIIKAKRQLEENPYMNYDGHVLLILSPSNKIYMTNGTCQCDAYCKGIPCWHRAAARLVERYFEMG